MLYFGSWFYITVSNEEKQNTKEKLRFFGTHKWIYKVSTVLLSH